jgi:hypothetical protein
MPALWPCTGPGACRAQATAVAPSHGASASRALFILGVAFAYLNAFLLGAGANAWGQGTLITGWICALIAVRVFYYRHHVVDKGRFPSHMFVDLVPAGERGLGPNRAGVMPYVALAGGLAVMLCGYVIFWVVN